MLTTEYHVHIWQVLPQLSCGDTCQIWMRCKECNRYFCEIEIFAYGEIDERSFSNPHPRVRTWGRLKIRILSYRYRQSHYIYRTVYDRLIFITWILCLKWGTVILKRGAGGTGEYLFFFYSSCKLRTVCILSLVTNRYNVLLVKTYLTILSCTELLCHHKIMKAIGYSKPDNSYMSTQVFVVLNQTPLHWTIDPI